MIRDLDDARRALGYDRIRLEAISYGTRVAQAYLREYGSHVDALVLLGTLAPDVRLPAEFAEAAQHELDALVADCVHDTGCAAAFPQLRDQLAALARGPLPPDVGRSAFSEWVRHALASAASSRGLPLAIARAAGGDFTAFHRAGEGAPLREAVLLAVECSEDIPAVDRGDTARAAARASWFGDARLDQEVASCAEWPHAAVPRNDDPVASDAPVLVFAGARDPITPPAYARRATQRMPRATIVDVPWMGHLPDGISHVDCLDQIEAAFLRDPHARVDTSCTAAIAPPPFALSR